MEEKLKDMLGKKPEELEGETLKLFEAIMKIADERDELRVRNKELEEENRIFALEGSNIALKIHIDKNYIPKSKIKEKIEEIKQEDLEIHNTDSQDVIIAKYEQRAILNLLQDLLKGEDE